MNPDEIDVLLLNAQLREELEPFNDDSLNLPRGAMSTQRENEYLASILAWERAPSLPIAQWFEPPLSPPPLESLRDDQLSGALQEAVGQLFSKRIVLEYTDHLNDRQLYALILRDILPAYEKKIDHTCRWLYWNCAEAGGDPAPWLCYYASDEEREAWSQETGEDLPPRLTPAYPRPMPRPAEE